jgi:23S rRNA U2552 (ribose-2'-O)-methylase RlmE/FtsJ
MTLQEIGLKYGTDKATFHKYCDFYEQELPGRNFNGRLLEIGVKGGASLRMWREYYERSEIVGIDINPPLDIHGCIVLQMDATDVYALKELGKFDIIIDDGSHMTKDQQITFEFAFKNMLKKGGFYVLEDVHTSFYTHYVNSRFTTFELFKDKGKLFQRIPGDTSDSNTIIIKK